MLRRACVASGAAFADSKNPRVRRIASGSGQRHVNAASGRRRAFRIAGPPRPRTSEFLRGVGKNDHFRGWKPTRRKKLLRRSEERLGDFEARAARRRSVAVGEVGGRAVVQGAPSNSYAAARRSGGSSRARRGAGEGGGGADRAERVLAQTPWGQRRRRTPSSARAVDGARTTTSPDSSSSRAAAGYWKASPMRVRRISAGSDRSPPPLRLGQRGRGPGRGRGRCRRARRRGRRGRRRRRARGEASSRRPAATVTGVGRRRGAGLLDRQGGGSGVGRRRPARGPAPESRGACRARDARRARRGRARAVGAGSRAVRHGSTIDSTTSGGSRQRGRRSVGADEQPAFSTANHQAARRVERRRGAPGTGSVIRSSIASPPGSSAARPAARRTAAAPRCRRASNRLRTPR